MKRALIINDRIAEFPPAEAVFHPDIEIAQVANNAAIGWVRKEGGGFGAPPAPELPPLKEQLAAHAAAVRYEREVGGLEFMGTTIATDRQSQALIAGAFALTQQQPETLIRFKTASGFVSLDAEQMAGIAIAVGQHVQSCFALEADVGAEIDDGTITTPEQIDAAFS